MASGNDGYGQGIAAINCSGLGATPDSSQGNEREPRMWSGWEPPCKKKKRCDKTLCSYGHYWLDADQVMWRCEGGPMEIRERAPRRPMVPLSTEDRPVMMDVLIRMSHRGYCLGCTEVFKYADIHALICREAR